VPAAEVARIGAAAEHLIHERPAFESRIRELRGQYVFAFGRSSEIGARHIREIAGRSRG
jgi:hypothetical protein